MIALAVGLLLAGLGAEWWHRYTGTPEYSLSQLGKAVKDQNYGKASYYVDEERIASAISQSLTDVLLAKSRVGRNPKTGDRVEVPAKKIPFFKPSKELKDMVNSYGEQHLTSAGHPGKHCSSRLIELTGLQALSRRRRRQSEETSRGCKPRLFKPVESLHHTGSGCPVHRYGHQPICGGRG